LHGTSPFLEKSFFFMKGMLENLFLGLKNVVETT